MCLFKLYHTSIHFGLSGTVHVRAQICVFKETSLWMSSMPLGLQQTGCQRVEPDALSNNDM